MRFLLVVGMAILCHQFSGQSILEGADSSGYVIPVHGNEVISEDDIKDLITIENQFELSNYQLNRNVSMSGFFESTYFYGIPQGMNSSIGMGGGLITNGNFSIDLGKTPLKFEFRYLEPALAPGTDNFFRLSFDSEKYKENMKLQKDLKLKVNEGIVDSLRSERVNSIKKLIAIDNEALQQPLGIDKDSIIISKPDLSTGFNGIPSLERPNATIDLNVRNQVESHMQDSVEFESLQLGNNSTTLDSIGNRADSLRMSIVKYEHELNIREKYRKQVTSGSVNGIVKGRASKFEDIASRIDKLQVGQINPSFRNLIVAGLPMNGFLLKYVSKEKKEYHFIHGQLIAINPIYSTTQIKFLNGFIQDFVPTSRNIGDRISALSFSIVKNDFLDISFTGLFAEDRYSNTAVPNSGDVNSRNGAYGILLRKRTLRHGEFVLEIAQSSFINSSMSAENTNGERTLSGGCGRFEWSLNTKDNKFKLKAQSKLTTPQFLSLANPFLRGDQWRSDMHTQIKISKKIQVEAGLGQISSNLINNKYGVISNFIYKTGFTLRPSKQLLSKIIFNYSEISKRFEMFNGPKEVQTRIAQVLLSSSYNKRVKNNYYNYNISINYFRSINDTLSDFLLDNRLFWDAEIEKLGLISAEIGVINSRLDNELEKYSLFGASLSKVVGDKLNLLVGSRLTSHKLNQWNVGWKLELVKRFRRNVSFSMSAERIVLDGFIDSEMKKVYSEFPYRFTSTIKLTLK
jgi:hypothetical protein